MGYVGNQQTEGFSQVPAKQDLTGATGTSLTLTHAVASAEGIDLFINNVRQEPTTAYSVGGDGVTVTLTGSVVGTDDIYVVYNSLARQTSTHPSNQALQATSGTFSGDLTVDTNTLYVDSTNNRVGIGTTSPLGKFMVKDGTSSPSALVVRQTSEAGAAALSLDSIFNNASNTDKEVASIKLGVITNGSASPNADIRFETVSSGTLSERMRITSAGVAINTTSANASYQTTIQSNSTKGALSIDGPATNGYWAAEVDMPSGSTYGILFKNAGSNVGNIRINASSTSYNTTSDYRLKTAVNYDWDATTRLKQLRPARFEWIVDGDDAVPVDGFLAHEVQDIVPEAISGTKDAMRDEEYEVTPAVLDEDGNEVTPAVMGTRSVPDYQGIDQSKLVPLLVKTIQELEARIAALEAS
jgi:hypothetical protein